MYKSIVFCLLAWLVCGRASLAQPFDRDQVEALALARQPRLQAAQLEVEATGRLVDQARLTPNPVLSLGAEAPALRVVSRVQLALSQALEMGGKREARTELAEAVRREAGVRQQEVQRVLLQDVRQAYAELLVAQRRLELETQVAEAALRQWKTAQGRFNLGDIARVEVMQLEADSTQAQAVVERSQSERESRRAGLAGWLGLPAGELRVQGKLGSSLPLPPLPDLLEHAMRHRPDLQLLTLEQERRRAELRLEEARGVSDLTLQAGVAYDRTYISPTNPGGGLTGVGQPVLSVMAGMSLPLPFHDDNSGNIAAAELRAQKVEAERVGMERQVRSEVESAYWSATANQRARRLLLEQTLPLTRETLNILERAYRVRARSLTELLNSRRAYLEAARTELEAAHQEELALIRLEAASAQNLPR